MLVQSNGKVRRSASEWNAILKEYRASGLSEGAFCRRKKIPKSTFSKWKKRHARPLATRKAKAAPPMKSPATFVEMTAPSAPPLTSSLGSGEMELSLPGGVVLRWKV